MSQFAKKIPITIIMVCIALILISVYLEQNKKARILHSLDNSIQSTNLTEQQADEKF